MTGPSSAVSPVVRPQTFTPRTGTPRSAADLAGVLRPRAPTAPSVVVAAPPPPVAARTPSPTAPFAYVLGPRATERACWLLGCANEDVREVEGALLCAYHHTRVAQFERAGAPTWAAAFVAMVRHHMLEHALCDGCRLAPVGPLPVGLHSPYCAACRAGEAPTSCRIPGCPFPRTRSANLALDGLCDACKGAVMRTARTRGHELSGAEWLVLVAQRFDRRANAAPPMCGRCAKRRVAAVRAPGAPYADYCGVCRKIALQKDARAERRAVALDRKKLERKVEALKANVQSLAAALREDTEASCATR